MKIYLLNGCVRTLPMIHPYFEKVNINTNRIKQLKSCDIVCVHYYYLISLIFD